MKIDVIQLELRRLGTFEVIGSGYIYTAEHAHEIFADRIGRCNVEYVAMLCMDNTNKIINYSNVAIGDIDSVNVTIASIIKVALVSNASKIIIAHNHPSGILQITKADISLTRHIGAVAKLVGIDLVDSVIVNADGDMIAIRSHLREIEL